MKITQTELNNHLQEVTKKFLKCGKPLPKEREKHLKENNYLTKYKLYNTEKEKLEALKKVGFSFSTLDHRAQAKIWSHIFKNTEYFGIGDMAIYHFKQFQGKKNHPLAQYWSELKSWAKYIENWAHSDMLCSVYCDILSEIPEKVYPELLKWSKSKSPWLNRVAIVSLLYYYNPKRNLLRFDEIIALVEPHLQKDHYYLQKAIGWNLRELSSAYPKQHWRFLKDNLLILSATAFTTAVEKIPKAKKEPLKLARRAARKKKSAGQ